MRPIVKKDFTTKIAIMYVINKFGGSIEGEVLTDIVMSVCEVSYFIFRQCLYELKNTNFIRSYLSDNVETYELANKGEQALDFFTSKLPYSLRIQINEYLKSYSPDLKSRNKFDCDYMPVNDLEYNVKLSYNEGNMPIMQLELRAGDKQQAKDLMRIMDKNKERIYTDIYNYIMKLADEKNNLLKNEDDINFFD